MSRLHRPKREERLEDSKRAAIVQQLSQLHVAESFHSFHDAYQPSAPGATHCKSAVQCTYESWRSLIARAIAVGQFPCLATEDDIILVHAISSMKVNLYGNGAKRPTQVAVPQ